ncbi:S1/P1 nuclease [Rhizobium soli]|uniref:S1/P1 nuclease n=1 Tax=Rhizobium soli TaxID=424798 RepID=UPI0031B60B4F
MLLLALGGRMALAWSSEGHKIVAAIAEQHLGDAARSEVLSLLQLEKKTSLVDVAAWADEMRDLDVPRQPSHSIRLPLTSAPYVQSRDCRNKNCILWAIEANIRVLRKGTSSGSAKVAALKYLTHFIGDLHQPLHSSIDTGQQKVVFEGRETTLHGVWDRELIKCQDINVDGLIGEIDVARLAKIHLDVASWAIEGRDIARDRIFFDLPQGESVIALPADYCATYASTVRVRLASAGYRLALLLNEVFSKP